MELPAHKSPFSQEEITERLNLLLVEFNQIFDNINISEIPQNEVKDAALGLWVISRIGELQLEVESLRNSINRLNAN